MGLNIRKSTKIGKSTRLNISKSGIGVSTGVKGFRVGVGPKGVRKTTSIPGTGVYYTEQKSWGSINKGSKGERIDQPYLSPQDSMMEMLSGINPRTPSRATKLLIAGFICLILSAIFILFLPVAFILLVISAAIMLFTKDGRIAICTDIAKKSMLRYNFSKAEKECNKVLKIDKDNESARAMLDFISKDRKYI
ncbi:DUF4236 domain-containing protein [Sporanaerobacter sp. PP17-6a]|uniref:DUF4236 domain-containing protein n=1 Tax=Sporanaerobacter sp. PP17-6a TaxID=1891289 RepID=UPI0008A09C59|nr:DUF4236 domain-containing protein [Sporanaerobacter sp. PP17-6a]SCL87976.1 hypothetical protein PP176A_1435 [Sporanaerobacter sp. PP17-6a]